MTRQTTESLNAGQITAIGVDTGPALVIAGAGTGKTRVIVERIIRLIDKGVKPESILALTFTEKAAEEMLDRVIGQLDLNISTDLSILTYNAFGQELLQTYAPEIGLSNRLKLMGEVSKLVFLREHFDQLELDYFAPISDPTGQISVLADYFSKLKQNLITPEGYGEYAAKLPNKTEDEALEQTKHRELANAYKAYIALCRQKSVIDYDDQLYLSVELLKARPNIAHQLQKKYSFILVDEFQDTNHMQSVLIDMLVNKEQNLMVVGDDDQSIYGWRGATLANILEFAARYPKTKELTLTTNYRSTQSILDSSYKLIQYNNPNRLESMLNIDKRLKSKKSPGKEVKLRNFENLNQELRWIAEDIAKRIKKPDLSIAVLTRRNATAQLVHESLDLLDVEHILAGISQDLYSHPAVSTMIEALKTVSDPDDNAALYHTLGGPLFLINPQKLSEYSSIANRTHEKLLFVLGKSDDEEINSALDQIVKWRGLIHETSVGTLAFRIMSDTSWKDLVYRQAEEDYAGSLQVKALAEWFNTLKEFERVTTTPSVVNYLDNLETLISAGDELSDDTLMLNESKVNVMSIHKAKGLEWDVVYIADCTEGSFPLRRLGSGLIVPDELSQKRPADDHYQEERRLMYVAMTRAKNELILTYSQSHNGITGRRPSRFIKEIFDNITKDSNPSRQKQLALEIFAPVNFSNNSQIKLPPSLMKGEDLILSVSQIGDYIRCPRDFYYRHILQVPAEPSAAGPLGTLLHQFIQSINESRKNNIKPPALSELRKKLEDNWPLEGYLSSKHRERSRQYVLSRLEDIYTKIMSDPIPAEIELPIKVKIKEANLVLKGRIDVVFETNKGTIIRDYKSSDKVNTAQKANNKARGSTQLTLYALAWHELKGEIPYKMELDYILTNQIGSVSKQSKSLISMKQKLINLTSDLKNLKFPLGTDHSYCRHP